MPYARITAIIRTARTKQVIEALCQQGVPGLTATHVSGLGEYRNYFCRDPMVDHIRLELFIPKEQADPVIEAIVSAAQTGVCGDGIVVAEPVGKVIQIRTGAPPTSAC